MKCVKLGEQVYPLDDRHRLRFLQGDFGIRVLVNGRWWMPDEPFQIGFNRSAAEFDSVESAVRSVQAAFGSKRFFWMDADENAAQMDTPSQFIRHIKESLGIGVSRTPRRKPR